MDRLQNASTASANTLFWIESLRTRKGSFFFVACQIDFLFFLFVHTIRDRFFFFLIRVRIDQIFFYIAIEFLQFFFSSYLFFFEP